MSQGPQGQPHYGKQSSGVHTEPHMLPWPWHQKDLGRGTWGRVGESPAEAETGACRGGFRAKVKAQPEPLASKPPAVDFTWKFLALEGLVFFPSISQVESTANWSQSDGRPLWAQVRAGEASWMAGPVPNPPNIPSLRVGRSSLLSPTLE